MRRRGRLRGGRVDRRARVDRRRGLRRARRRAADLSRDAPLPRADPLRLRAAGHEPRRAHARPPNAGGRQRATSAPRWGRTPSGCSATRSGSRRRTCPSSVCVGDPVPSRPRRRDRRARGRAHPRGRAARRRAAQRQRRRGGGGARGRARRRAAALRDRCPGPARGRRGGAVDRGRRRRPPARGRHPARAGIVPKLRAAVTAARLGVRAEIGETAVVG